jgi:hypothetical protein
VEEVVGEGVEAVSEVEAVSVVEPVLEVAEEVVVLGKFVKK